MFKMYLCGPISGLSYDEATDWRAVVTDAVGSRAECFSPMRGKQYLSNQGPIPTNQSEAHPLAGDLAINARDSWDVRRADVILANFVGTTKVSIGSLMEIADAWNQGKYIILVMEPGNLHDHPFLRARVSITFPTLVEAVRYINDVL